TGCADDTPASMAPSHATAHRAARLRPRPRECLRQSAAACCSSRLSCRGSLHADLRRAVLVEPDGDVLLLLIDLEGIVAAVAADAAGLDATDRRRKMAHVLRVHPYHAGLDPLRDAMRAADIAGPDIGGQTVADIVGDAQRIR